MRCRDIDPIGLYDLISEFGISSPYGRLGSLVRQHHQRNWGKSEFNALVAFL